MREGLALHRCSVWNAHLFAFSFFLSAVGSGNVLLSSFQTPGTDALGRECQTLTLPYHLKLYENSQISVRGLRCSSLHLLASASEFATSTQCCLSPTSDNVEVHSGERPDGARSPSTEPLLEPAAVLDAPEKFKPRHAWWRVCV
jgi:hypothetical protein